MGSAGIALLAALEQAYWQRWNSFMGSARIALLAALEQLYKQRWNRPISSTRIVILGNSYSIIGPATA